LLVLELYLLVVAEEAKKLSEIEEAEEIEKEIESAPEENQI
tara:strand:+ start:1808 stop:1930 length:123 start_codon:yes stop_codon:yes gene_type:complete